VLGYRGIDNGFQTEYQRGTLLAPYEEHWIRVRPINEAGKKRPGLIIKKADKSADNGESAGKSPKFTESQFDEGPEGH